MSYSGKKNFSRIDAGVFIFIIVYGIALYFIPLQSNAFYFDDHSSVEYNGVIESLNIPQIFHTFNTRFLVGLSFALNYKLCALHPSGYRLINLLIHCLNAFLVYLLIRSTLELFLSRDSSPYGPRMTNKIAWPAFFGAMLFLCHPLQTEPVNFITQRFVLMGTFFYLLTIYSYIQYRCRSKRGYWYAAMGSAIAAMFCKEFVVTLPLMLALYEFYFLGSVHEAARKRWKHLIPFFIIVLIVPVLLFRTPPEAIGVAAIADSDFIQVSKTVKVVNHVNITRAYGGVSRHQYFLTELNVVCTYVRLLFLPVNQNLDYDYPLAHGIDMKTALCGLFLLGLLGVAWVTYKSCRIISFGILWFFIALSVESSFIPIGHVIAEYRVYLGSIGFVFLIMNLIYMRRADPRRLNMIAAAIIIILSIVTFQRNKVWRDEVSLWGDALQKSPNKARPYYNRGFVYLNQGKFNEAIQDFNEAIKIKPDYTEVYINRGIMYYEAGNLPQALLDYNKALTIDPHVAQAYFNRGDLYAKQNNLAQALLDYTKAIEINPDYAEAYTNRGSIYVKQGDLTHALFNYNKAIELYPAVTFPTYLDVVIEKLKTSAVGYLFKNHYISYADAYYNRGCVYDKLGNLAQAVSDYSLAIKIYSKYADAYNNRGYIYGRQGNYPLAIADFTKAIEINPGIAGYYYNRALGFKQLGDYASALADIKKAEELGYVVNPEFFKALKKL